MSKINRIARYDYTKCTFKIFISKWFHLETYHFLQFQSIFYIKSTCWLYHWQFICLLSDSYLQFVARFKFKAIKSDASIFYLTSNQHNSCLVVSITVKNQTLTNTWIYDITVIKSRICSSNFENLFKFILPCKNYRS